MQPYIDAAKQQIKSIVADIKKTFLNESQVRIAVVSYKDHCDTPNIQFLDFTTSTDEVIGFLTRLSATGGADAPEAVLGGLQQALHANWEQQTRCLIHIADAPSHGSQLHDFSPYEDSYYRPGSEPHGLTWEPLLRKFAQLKINYVFLRITENTDRMTLLFSGIYGYTNATLYKDNKYHAGRNLTTGTSRKHVGTGDPLFEESYLGTTYSELRHLVVKSVTNSVSRTAGRLTLALSKERKPSKGRVFSPLDAIDEGGSGARPSDSSDISRRLETAPPQWTTPGWLDERLEVEGFCPAITIHDSDTLNEMMESDKGIRLSELQLTVYARSKPFGKGAVRMASYARTAASSSPYVVKSFIEDGRGRAHFVEDMRIQALCKAFALEFNALLKVEPPLDFVATSCLQMKSGSSVGEGNDCLSMEPFIDGTYVKYNNNTCYVNANSHDRFNQIAQAFSHSTFERSWGKLLVNDLQGVGHLLTDPSIQTVDEKRFKLNDTNFHEASIKCFFAVHVCNSFCQQLRLRSNKTMFATKWAFRDRWPTLGPTVCCSNKLCRSIIRLSTAHSSERFLNHHWCDKCWPQLQETTVRWICEEPGPVHESDVSRFFHQSQGQLPPKKCSKHRERDTTTSSDAAVGGSMWSRMKSKAARGSISGKEW